MFRLFRRKGEEKVSAEFVAYSYSDVSKNSDKAPLQPSNCPDSKMARLMELIGGAIEDWAAEYHLENLPKKVVFKQALDAMRIMEHVMDSREG